MKIELGRSFGDSRTGNRLSNRVRPSLQALEGKIFLTSMAGAVPTPPPAQVANFNAYRTAQDDLDLKQLKAESKAVLNKAAYSASTFTSVDLSPATLNRQAPAPKLPAVPSHHVPTPPELPPGW